MNFNRMSHLELIIYCYDYRPDLYRRLLAKTSEAALRGWLDEPKPVSKFNINASHATIVSIGDSNQITVKKIKK